MYTSDTKYKSLYLSTPWIYESKVKMMAVHQQKNPGALVKTHFIKQIPRIKTPFSVI